MQIALPNQSLEGTSRGVLKSSEHELFITHNQFSATNFIVVGIAQKICFLLIIQKVNKSVVQYLPLQRW